MHSVIEVEEWVKRPIPFGVKESIWLTFPLEQGKEGKIPLHIISGDKMDSGIVDTNQSAHPSVSGPVLLILAAVHGDEYEGVQTIIELCRELEPQHVNGTVLMVPVANMLSYEGQSRITPEDGRNLAREFPGNPGGDYTQRLAWHLDQALISRADFLLDLHSGGTSYEVPLLAGYYHNEQVLTGIRSRKAVEVFGIDVLWGHAEVAPGRTISAATERGIPWIYTEAYGGGRIRKEELMKFRTGVFRLLNHLGMLRNPDLWITGDPDPIRYRLGGDGNFDLSVSATCEGFFIPDVHLLEQVRKGDKIGSICSLFGEELAWIEAAADGVVVALSGTPLVREGTMIYTLARAEV